MKFIIILIIISISLSITMLNGGNKDELWLRHLTTIERYEYDAMNILQEPINKKEIIVYLHLNKISAIVELYALMVEEDAVNLITNYEEKVFKEFPGYKQKAYVLKFPFKYINSHFTLLYLHGNNGKEICYLLKDFEPDFNNVVKNDHLSSLLKAFENDVFDGKTYDENENLAKVEEFRNIVSTVRNQKLEALSLEMVQGFNIDNVHEFVTMLYMTNRQSLIEQLLPIVDRFNKQTNILVKNSEFTFTSLPNTDFIEASLKTFYNYFDNNKGKLNNEHVVETFEPVVDKFIDSIMEVVIAEYAKITFKYSGVYKYFALYLKHQYLNFEGDKFQIK
jgi:hypothetical protein